MRSHRNKSLLLVALAAALLLPGCVSWRSLQPVPPSVAAGRRLARQGVAAIEMQQWDEAETLLRDAVDKAPEEPEAQRYLAEALWRRGATDEAMQHMAIAAQFDRHDPTTAVRAGEMLLATGGAKQAIRQADRAVRLDNTLASAWTLRGRAYVAEGDFERGLADFQRALLLTPNDSDVLLEMAHLYHQRQQHQRCLATLHRLQDNSTAPERVAEVLELEGRTYLALNRPHLAAELVAQAVALSGPTAELQNLQALTEKQLNVEISSLPRPDDTRFQ